MTLKFFEDQEIRPNWLFWQNEVRPLLEQVQKLIGCQALWQTAIFASLPTGAEIAEHRDSNPLFAQHRRIHIPLKTNDQVHFFVDGARHELLAGRVYEIDNLRPHSVKNRGGSDRVHLIADFPIDCE